MAKHKKKRPHYTSKGERPNTNRSLINAVRADRTDFDKIVNKLKAWKSGKKGTVTIPNPNTTETDKPFIKVSFDRYFGNGYDYKTMRNGVKRSDDKNKVELV